MKHQGQASNRRGRGSSILILSILIASVFFSIIPVQAQNMSVTSFNLLTTQDLDIYTANATYYGSYNTSSPYIPLPAEDFQVIIRPNGLSRFTDPETMLEDGFDFVESNWVALLVIGVIFGLASGRLW